MKVSIPWSLATVMVATSLSGSAFSEQEWRIVEGGTTAVTLNAPLMRELGLKVADIRETTLPFGDQESPIAFRLNNSTDLSFVTIGGSFKGFIGGKLAHDGGFGITSKRGSQSIFNFEIVPKGQMPWDGLSFRWGKSGLNLNLDAARIVYDRSHKQLSIQGMDMTISHELAMAFGKPQLTGQYIGMASVLATAIQTGGDLIDDFVPGPTDDTLNDIKLHRLSSLTYQGHRASDGYNGFSCSTTSCNAGTNQVNWYRAMDTRHPMISFNMYRLKDGRFEQIGLGWLKHGFTSTNSVDSLCGTCQNPGTGNLIGIGCIDTYGVGNNNDRNWLGGRNEVNPFTGVWTCSKSYFSNYIDDCVRRNNGSEFGSDPVAHRIEAHDQDLGATNSTFFYEAYYITQGDQDKYNNIGSRQTLITQGTGSWTSTDTGAFLQGPALYRWGTVRNTATPRAEGDILAASTVTDIGGGMYHYEYAFYNHDCDRQVREISIPVPDSATVTNIGFHDADRNAGNNWASSRSNGKITWSTETFAQNPGANSLKYSTLYNVRFDCNIPAGTQGQCAMGLFKAGTLPCLVANIETPQALYYPISYAITIGSSLSGGLCDLFFAEGNRVVFISDAAAAAGQIEFTGEAPSASPASNKFLLKSSVNRVGLSRVVELYNYSTSTWDVLESGEALTTATSVVADVTGSGTAYVQTGAVKEVKSRVTFSPVNDEEPAADGWGNNIDQATWQF